MSAIPHCYQWNPYAASPHPQAPCADPYPSDAPSPDYPYPNYTTSSHRRDRSNPPIYGWGTYFNDHQTNLDPEYFVNTLYHYVNTDTPLEYQKVRAIFNEIVLATRSSEILMSMDTKKEDWASALLQDTPTLLGGLIGRINQRNLILDEEKGTVLVKMIARISSLVQDDRLFCSFFYDYLWTYDGVNLRLDDLIGALNDSSCHRTWRTFPANGREHNGQTERRRQILVEEGMSKTRAQMVRDCFEQGALRIQHPSRSCIVASSPTSSYPYW